MTRDEQDAVILLLSSTLELVERGWTSGAFARDARGHAVNVNDQEACRWCLVGALTRAECVLRAEDPESAHLLHRAVGYTLWSLNRVVGMDLLRWNDAPGRAPDHAADLLTRVLVEWYDAQEGTS